jgi:hypothetical protein
VILARLRPSPRLMLGRRRSRRDEREVVDDESLLVQRVAALARGVRLASRRMPSRSGRCRQADDRPVRRGAAVPAREATGTPPARSARHGTCRADQDRVGDPCRRLAKRHGKARAPVAAGTIVLTIAATCCPTRPPAAASPAPTTARRAHAPPTPSGSHGGAGSEGP